MWSSDADDDFAEYFEDVLNVDDEEELDDICDYLIIEGWLDEEEEFDIESEDGNEDEDEDEDEEDNDDDDRQKSRVIEGTFKRVR
jgi:hypothetical protein